MKRVTIVEREIALDNRILYDCYHIQNYCYVSQEILPLLLSLVMLLVLLFQMLFTLLLSMLFRLSSSSSSLLSTDVITV